MFINSPDASVGTSDSAHGSTIIPPLVDYLYRVGVQRPDWRRTSWLLPFLLPTVASVAYIWLIITTPIPPAAHLLALALLASAWAGSTAWARHLRPADWKRKTTHFRYRGESRAETNARRADTNMNLRVAAISAVLAFVGGIALTLAIGWLDIGGTDSPAPNPTSQQTP